MADPVVTKDSSQASTEAAPSTRAKSWHDNPGLVALVASLIALVAPVTTAVYGYVKGENDYRLSKQAQDHTTRTHYLGKAIEPAQEVTRIRYLRYLAATEADPKFLAWARSELAVVEKQISDLEKERDSAQELQRRAEERIAKLEARSKPGGTEAEISVIRKQLADAQNAERIAQRDLRVAQERLVARDTQSSRPAPTSTQTDKCQVASILVYAAKVGVDYKTGEQACYSAAGNRKEAGLKWSAQAKGKTIDCECIG
ncbi:MAG TPA: hypothetical protein VN493_19185 [Thermoanaerobaculia bacterium]|nr:hypothetical protein [Thermoanaerobaculia bacterium]